MQELVRVDGTTVGTGDRKVEPAGVGEAVLEFEGVTVLSHEQAAGGEIRAHGAVLFDGVVGTASANVDRAGGGAHGRYATDHGGAERPVGPDRKNVVLGKSVSVRVDLGGLPTSKKTQQTTLPTAKL